jgi:hypothetical protein
MVSGSIVITSPHHVTSNTATFSLNCAPPDITVSALSATFDFGESSGASQTVTCGDTPLPFDVTGTISSDQTTTAPYQFTHSDGSSGSSGHVSVGPGSGTSVTDEVSPPKISSPKSPWSLTDTLVVTTTTGATKQSLITLSVSCTYAPLRITTGPLPTGTVNSPYSATIQATGGDGVYAWSATGLPEGLSIDPKSGVISGIPAVQGTFMVEVTVSDADQPALQPAMATFSLTIFSNIG